MAHLPDLIRDLALILAAAATMTILFKVLKQPVVLGYIIAGLLVGPHIRLLPTVSDMESVKTWAEIGVIFLLFGLGLEFSFKKLVRVGGPASITAVVEILGMMGIGYATGRVLGWSTMDSIFLGGILSISSTTIIIRAFEELGVKGKKFASLVFGALIVEDLGAILLMVLLTTIAVSQKFEGAELFASMTKLGFFLTIWFVAGIFLLPSLLKRVKRHLNDEMTLVISISLCLLTVLLAVSAGFSPALGAFIMGSILAETTEAEKIEHLINPVKDLFGAVFFVSVGMMIDPSVLSQYLGPIILITIVTVVGKFITTGGGALLAGQPLKTSVQTGMSLSQIGEFSFIIATLGLTLGVISDFLYPIAVAVSAITTFTTPYLIKSSGSLASWIERKLPASWNERLERYASATKNMSSIDQGRVMMKSFVLKLVLHSLLTFAIFIIGTKLLRPIFFEKVGAGIAGRIFSISITLILASPFLWALVLGKYTTRRMEDVQKYKVLFVVFETIRVITAISLVTLLVSRYFTAGWLVFVPALLFGALLYGFAKKFETIYLWLEDRFLSNLNERENVQIQKERRLPQIAPWEAHIARFEVSGDSFAVGKTLMELGVREKFGVTIALIERGNRTITAPSRDAVLYPYDRVAAIGDDEQLERLKNFLEPQATIVGTEDGTDEDRYQLHPKTISPESELIGKPIRDSGIREATSGLVVGIEREGKRILNPDSNLTFQSGDLVWIVGDRQKILELK